MTIKRHLFKTFSWRLVASIDTLVVSLIITNSFEASVNILSFEVVIKTILYFFHERIWSLIQFKKSIKRHLFKTFSWRILAIIVTFVIVIFITDNISYGYQIGVVETITKMILYFIHERVWYKIKYGREKRAHL